MLSVELCGEVVEERRRDLHDVTAPLAHEVVVRPVGQVEHGATGTQLDTLDDAELEQAVEDAVHRALVELGIVGAHSGDDLGSRHVVPRPADQCVDDHPARPGDPHSAVTESLDDLGTSINGHHSGEVTERPPVASDSLLQAIRSSECLAVRSSPCE